MSAGVVNNDKVADPNLRKRPVNSEFVIILAKSAGYIPGFNWSIMLFSRNLYFVPGAIHCRPKQVCGAGIQSEIILIYVFFMDDPAHKAACRAQKPAAQFRMNGNMSSPDASGWSGRFAFEPLFQLPRYLVLRLAIAVWNADAARRFHGIKFGARFIRKLTRQF